MTWENEQGSKLPFGKYEDTPIEDLPFSYLTWLLEQKWFEKKFPELMKEANAEWLWRKQYDERMDD